jgi:hypothetical protein
MLLVAILPIFYLIGSIKEKFADEIKTESKISTTGILANLKTTSPIVYAWLIIVFLWLILVIP